MPVLHPIKNLKSITARKKIGDKVGYGACDYGITAFGTPVDFAGIYRIRHYNGKIYHEKMDFFDQKITHTDGQNIQRGKYIPAVNAWHALSSSQKAVYNRKAKGRHYCGYHLFMKEQLKS